MCEIIRWRHFRCLLWHFHDAVSNFFTITVTPIGGWDITEFLMSISIASRRRIRAFYRLKITSLRITSKFQQLSKTISLYLVPKSFFMSPLEVFSWKIRLLSTTYDSLQNPNCFEDSSNDQGWTSSISADFERLRIAKELISELLLSPINSEETIQKNE